MHWHEVAALRGAMLRCRPCCGYAHAPLGAGRSARVPIKPLASGNGGDTDSHTLALQLTDNLQNLIELGAEHLNLGLFAGDHTLPFLNEKELKHA